MKLIKSFSAYTLAGVYGAAASFFVLPILSHYLSTADYGILSIFNSYVLIIMPLIGLVASGIISVEFFKIQDKKEFASFFTSVQLIPIIPFVFFLVISFLFGGYLSRLLEIPTEFSNYLFLIPLIAILTIYIESYLAYLVVKKSAYHYLVVNIVKSSVEIGLTLLFVVYFDMGWFGRILSWLIASLLFTFVASIYFYKEDLFSLKVTKKYVMAGVWFGLPLILHTLGKFVINQSDRIFIAKMVNVDEVGVYNIAYQLASILLIFVSAFSNLYVPYLYERLADFNKKTEKEILQISYLYTVILIAGTVIITFGSRFLFGWFIDVKFIGAIPYIFWISFSYFLWGMYALFSAYIYYFNKNKYLAYLSFINVITNIAFNYIFIKQFGALGAAYATCLSYFITLVMIIFFATRLVSISWFNVGFVFNGFFKVKDGK
ncbi:lipopolysaccharide biosynthesis protein [Rufibacter radiotolerans]|nr:oligosaccharide flippase family protein [Rufibacter radiotolerans]